MLWLVFAILAPLSAFFGFKLRPVGATQTATTSQASEAVGFLCRSLPSVEHPTLEHSLQPTSQSFLATPQPTAIFFPISELRGC